MGAIMPFSPQVITRNRFWNASFLVLCLAGWLAAPPILSADPSATSGCSRPLTLGADDHWQIDAGSRSEDWIAVTIPEAGLLRLDVDAPGHAVDQPLVGYWGDACTRDLRTAAVVDRASNHLTLRVAPGTALFRIGDQRGLGLRSRLDVATTFIADLGRDAPTKGGEDEELIEIDGFANPGRGLPTKGGEDEELIEIDGFAAPAPDDDTLTELLRRLCQPVEGDDHGDVAACATPLGDRRVVEGRLAADRADSDYFRLDLATTGRQARTNLWRVGIEAVSEADLVVTLYDRRGRRLAWTEEGGQHVGAALGAGEVYVRVEGREGASGPYRLAFDVTRW
jgi:hypothetical protein